MAAYWAGNPWPEPDRLALLREEALADDMFDASIDDFKAMMERGSEYERDNPGGV